MSEEEQRKSSKKEEELKKELFFFGRAQKNSFLETRPEKGYSAATSADDLSNFS